MNPAHEPLTEEKEIRLADLTLIKSLWPFIKPFFWLLALSVLLTLVVTFFELIIPILTQKALDGFILSADQTDVVNLFGIKIYAFKTFGMIFLGLVIIEFIINFTQTLFMEYTGQKIIFNLRCALFSHMTQLPVSYYDENASGRLVSRVAGDIENMSEMFTSILVFMAKDLMLMAGILAFMYYLNPKLAMYIFWIVPVILVIVVSFSRAARKAFRTIRQKIGEINHNFSEGLTGIKVIQTTATRLSFISRFERLNLEHFKAAMYQIKIFALFMPFIGFLNVCATALIIWGGSLLVMEKSLTLGELVAFLAYIKLFFRPLRELSEKFNLLQNALASAERIITVLNRPKADTGTEKSSSSLPTIKTIDTVQFNDINFSYNKKDKVLQNISFSLDQGKSIGIAGQTGSGKSSIINLLTGFYSPDSGGILINGRDHQQIDIKEIRSRTALVMQDPILFSGSIRENICPWGVSVEDVELEVALRKAGCHFLFDKFDGLDTQLMEGGRPLSSGEKQLVCIARAFAFNPDLIIFDEATSYMDSQSEKAIHTAMEKLMLGRLSIVIAHRLSTIRECDTILLLRDGKIREHGPHRKLVELKGEYYHLLEKERI